jgi:hypothetical protein
MSNRRFEMFTIRQILRTLPCQPDGRGRDSSYPLPPAQIRTSGITAYGSYLRSCRETFAMGRDEPVLREEGIGSLSGQGAELVGM